MAFTHLTETKHGTIYLSIGFHNKLPTWHYVRVTALKVPLFLNAAKAKRIDVAQFGEVLFSGWGKEPPEEIRKKVLAM